jgi:hypothetical protein
LILSKSSLGSQPAVERIHFYSDNISVGRPIKNLFSNSIHICEDYSGTERLWFELNVTEIDTKNEKRKEAIDAFRTLAITAGAVFPAVIHYAFAAGAAASLVNSIYSAFKENIPVIKAPIALFPGETQYGEAPLQSGTYVTFATPVDEPSFKMLKNGTLETDNHVSKVSYIVFNVSPNKRVNPDFVMSQKIATLLTQIRSGQNSMKSTIEFLNETLTDYSNFRKLRRYRDLKDKAALTDEEKSLIAEIEKIADLKPFLPKS